MRLIFISFSILISSFTSLSGQPLYFDWVELEVTQTPNGLRDYVEEKIQLDGYCKVEIYMSPYDPFGLIMQQGFGHIFKDYPDQTEMVIHHLLEIDPGNMLHGPLDDRGEVQDAFRQMVMKNFYPEKFSDYLLERGKHILFKEEKFTNEWDNILSVLGISKSLFIENSNNYSYSNLEANVENALNEMNLPQGQPLDPFHSNIMVNNIDNIDFNKFSSLILNRNSIVNLNDCCDYERCILSVLGLGGRYPSLEKYIIISPIAANINIAIKLFQIEKCIENPCSGIVIGAPGECPDGTFCEKQELILLQEGTIVPVYSQAAICQTCPTIDFEKGHVSAKFFNNGKPAPISDMDLSSTWVLSNLAAFPVRASTPPNQDFELIRTIDGKVETIPIPLEPGSGNKVDTYFEDIKPGQEVCYEIRGLSPPEISECNLKKCTKYECPEYKVIFENGNIQVEIIQNGGYTKADEPNWKDFGLFTQVQIIQEYKDANGNIIERPKPINTFESKIETIFEGLDDHPEIEEICLTIYPNSFYEEARVNECGVYQECFSRHDLENCLEFNNSIFIECIPSDASAFRQLAISNVTGGVQPYFVGWEWGTPSTSSIAPSINNILPNTTYYATVTDSNNPPCNTELSFRTSSKEDCCEEGVFSGKSGKKGNGDDCSEIIIDAQIIQPVGNNPDGEIEIIITGPFINYNYAWKDIPDGTTDKKTRTNLEQGTYCVEVAPADEEICCTANKCFEIISDYCFNNPLEVQSQSTPACGSSTGSVILTFPSTALPPYSISGIPNQPDVSTSNNLYTISNFPQGEYHLNVIDGNGCRTTVSGVVGGEITDFEIYLSEVTNSDWCGQTGSISLTTNSIIDATYSWSNGAVTQNLNEIEPGEYCVNITGNCGASITECFTVAGMDTPGLDLEVLRRPCRGDKSGAIGLSIVSGDENETYSVEWEHSANGGVFSPVGSITNVGEDFIRRIDGLEDGSYKFTLSNGNCSVEQTVSILPISPPMIEDIVVTNASCAGAVDGSIELIVDPNTGPHTYKFGGEFGSSPIFTGLAPGSYPISVWGQGGCVTTETIIVGNNPNLVLEDISIEPTCINNSDGSIDITVSGGFPPYTFIWSNGETTEDLTSLEPGAYSLILRDGEGTCSASFPPFIVNEIPGPQIVLESAIAPYVMDPIDPDKEFNIGSIETSVNGGSPPYTFLWNNNATTDDIFNLNEGEYSLTVTDANGCESIFSYFLIACGDGNGGIRAYFSDITPPEPIIGRGSLTAEVLSGTPPYIYDWVFTRAGGPSTSIPNSLNTKKIDVEEKGKYEVTITDDCGQSITISTWVRDQADCDRIDSEGIFAGLITIRDQCDDWFDFVDSGLRINKLTGPNVFSSSGIFATGAPNIIVPFGNGTATIPGGGVFQILWESSNSSYDGQVSTIRATVDPDDPFQGPTLDVISGPKFLDANAPETFKAIVVDAYGCQHEEEWTFENRVPYCFPNTTTLGAILNSSPYNLPSSSTLPVVSGFRICLSCDGGETCKKEIVEERNAFLAPTDFENPCKGGGNLRLFGCVNGSDGIPIDVGLGGFSTEFVSDQIIGPSEREGFCRYRAGCYFPDVIPGIQGPIFVDTFKELPCPSEICDNGEDDDGDGLIDCYDCDDCEEFSTCVNDFGDHDDDGISDLCDPDVTGDPGPDDCSDNQNLVIGEVIVPTDHRNEKCIVQTVCAISGQVVSTTEEDPLVCWVQSNIPDLCLYYVYCPSAPGNKVLAYHDREDCEPDPVNNPNPIPTCTGTTLKIGNTSEVKLSSDFTIDKEDIILINDDLLVYPNPFSDKLIVSIKNNEISKNYLIEVFDVTGRLVYTKNLLTKIEKSIVELNLEHLKAGMYFVSIFDNRNKPSTFKVIKN